MPRLPSVQDLQRPTPQVVRGTVAPRVLTPTGAESQALQQAGQRVFAGSNVVLQAVQEQQERKDHLYAEDAWTKLRQKELELTFGENGFTKKQGSNALTPDFREEYVNQFDTVAEDISAGLLNDRQRGLFKSRAAVSKIQYEENLLKHTAKEHETFVNSTYEGVIATEIQNNAARLDDPSAVALSKERISAVTKLWGQYKGMNNADIEAEITKNIARLELSGVVRDIGLDPSATHTRLMTDVDYAPNIDPLTRERLSISALKQAEAERRKEETSAIKENKEIGDELLKNVFEAHSKGELTSKLVEDARPYITPAEYRSSLKMFEGDAAEDNKDAYAHLQRLLTRDPSEAVRQAFFYHDNGLIKNETLKSTRTEAAQASPGSEYRTSLEFIRLYLDPGEAIDDPFGRARYAEASLEFKDYMNTNPEATNQEIRAKAHDIVDKWTIAPVRDAVARTAMGIRSSDPQMILDELAKKAHRLQAERAAGRIGPDAYRIESEKLNDLRKKTEANLRAKQSGRE